MRFDLLSDVTLTAIIDGVFILENYTPDGKTPLSPFIQNMIKGLCMEILEFRRAHGQLGCEWLEC